MNTGLILDSNRPTASAQSQASCMCCSIVYVARQPERPMPDQDIAATRKSSAKNGAMKLHQSACALLPGRKSRPGLPICPQASVSICTPSTLTKLRTGALMIAL